MATRGTPSAPGTLEFEQIWIDAGLSPAAIASLVERLDADRERLELEWLGRLLEKPVFKVGRRTRDDLRRWTHACLPHLLTIIGTVSAATLRRQAYAVCDNSQQLDLTVGEVVAGLQQFQDLALSRALAGLDPDQLLTVRSISHLKSRLCLSIVHCASRHAERMRRSAEAERKRTAHVFEATRRTGRSLQLELVLRQACLSIAAAAGAPSCAIYLREDSAERFLPGCALENARPIAFPEPLDRPLDPKADSAVAATLDAFAPSVHRGDDIDSMVRQAPLSSLGAAAALWLPVLMGGRILGVALVLSPDANAFSDDEVELARAITEAVAPAIEHARRYARIQEEIIHCRARHQIFAATLQRVGLKRVLELVGGETLKLMNAQGVSVALLEKEGEMRVAFSLGDLPEWARQGLSDVASERPLPVEPVLINRLVAERFVGAGRAFDVRELAPGRVPDSLRNRAIVVPMRPHGDPLGVLQIVDERRAFDQSDVRLASLIAEQLGLAIEHARLHDHQERMIVLEERNRLSRDLHDSVTQSLYGASTLAEAAARLLDAGQTKQAAEHVRELRNVVLGSLREMRHLIFELSPPEVDQEGIVGALRKRLDAVEGRSGIATRLVVDEAIRLPEALERELYGIAIEACANAVRHAQASSLEIELHHSDDRVTLVITDDGTGFDLETGQAKGGLGLRSMISRVASLDGELSIDSAPGRGTRITVEVPIRRPDATSDVPSPPSGTELESEP